MLDLTVEVKTPKDGSGFKQLESWLADHDILFLRRDRQKLLVLLPWDVYLRLMQGAVRRAVEAEVGRCQDTATN